MARAHRDGKMMDDVQKTFPTKDNPKVSMPSMKRGWPMYLDKKVGWLYIFIAVLLLILAFVGFVNVK